MSADFFLDTNILAYTFDYNETDKQLKAKNLVREALQGKGCISWQVIHEFCNVSLKKFSKPLSLDQLREYQEKVLFPLCTVWASEKLMQEALTVKLETSYSWYDCLILTAAVQSGCRYLYSEDLQHKFTYRSVQILNPFLS